MEISISVSRGKSSLHLTLLLDQEAWKPTVPTATQSRQGRKSLLSVLTAALSSKGQAFHGSGVRGWVTPTWHK